MSDTGGTVDTGYRTTPTWWAVQLVALIAAAGFGYFASGSDWGLAALFLVVLLVATRIGVRIRRDASRRA